MWCCFLLLLVALLFAPIKANVRPNCQCIIFDDTYSKEYGIFTSPDWPVPYDDNTDCLLYTFLAPDNHIVEINFDEFDLQKSEELGCEYGDYVQLYLHLNSNGINDRTPSNAVICGKYLDIETTYYSANSVLIFMFHSDWRSGNNTGFRGTFRFIKKSLFHTDGQLVASSVCDYTFRHEPLLDSALNRKIHSTESVQDLLASLPPTAPLMQQDQPFGAVTHGNNDSGQPKFAPYLARRILQLNGGTGHRGHFFSPQYPSTYPKNIRCQYQFQAQPNERVRVLFVDVSLQRTDQSCIASPDVIKVFDGSEIVDPLMGQICGQTSYLEMLSSSGELLVQFTAKSHISAKGFKAEFAFVPIVPPSTSQTTSLGHPWWAIPPSKPGKPWHAAGNQSSTVSSFASCDRWFTSDGGSNGTFTSPNFPLPYTPNTKCSYHFVGYGKERVQIEFQEFDLHRAEDQHRDCEISDSVTAYITTNGQKDRIDGYCGQDLPPRLMSNGHRLTIEFKSLQHNEQGARRPLPVSAPKSASFPSFTGNAKFGGGNGQQKHTPVDNRPDDEDYNFSAESKENGADRPGRKLYFPKKPLINLKGDQPAATDGGTKRQAKGFRATYKFVTNFGVETGKQDSKSVCGFVYNSTESRNGTFTSPNYPGLYPKDTECHYFFYGNYTERIQIVFQQFDVEGVTPCTLETASDYVEFSNQFGTDRKLFRHCGIKKPETVESESDFFRVTFKSNGRFDGTGFNATYGFFSTNQGSKHNKNIRKTVSTSMSTSAASTSTTASLAVLCTLFLLSSSHRPSL